MGTDHRNTGRGGRVALGLVGALLLLAGIGVGTTSAVAAPPPDGLRACWDEPFPMSVFDQPADYETKNTGLAKALRRAVKMRGMGYPKKNWWLLYKDGRSAEVASGNPEREGGLWVISFERKKGVWKWAGSGDCRLAAYRPGVNIGEWNRSRGQDYSRSTTSFKVDVYEMSCNGGAPPTGRVTKPVIEYYEDSIVVTYFVKPNDPGAYTCPGAPPVTKILKLEEPIGDREVLDGGTYPYSKEMEAPGPHGFFDPADWSWFSRKCFARKGTICVTQDGPSRVKEGKTATYKVRIRASRQLYGVKLSATTGATPNFNEFIGPMKNRQRRVVKFEATCPEAEGSEPSPLTAVPVVTFKTREGGKVRTHTTGPLPRITCVPHR